MLLSNQEYLSPHMEIDLKISNGIRSKELIHLLLFLCPKDNKNECLPIGICKLLRIDRGNDDSNFEIDYDCSEITLCMNNIFLRTEYKIEKSTFYYDQNYLFYFFLGKSKNDKRVSKGFKELF